MSARQQALIDLIAAAVAQNTIVNINAAAWPATVEEAKDLQRSTDEGYQRVVMKAQVLMDLIDEVD